MTAATRLPSGKRESRMGFDSEMSSPSRRAIFLTATIRDLSPKDTPENVLKESLFFDKHTVGPIDHDLADRIVENQVFDRL